MKRHPEEFPQEILKDLASDGTSELQNQIPSLLRDLIFASDGIPLEAGELQNGIPSPAGSGVRDLF